MSPDEVLEKYQSLKLHFTTDDYNYFKYGGKLKHRAKGYETRPDHGYLFRLSRKYQSHEIEGLVISNLLRDPATWPGMLVTDEARKTYEDWLAFQQSLTYNVVAEVKGLLSSHHTFAELFHVEEGRHPPLVRLYLAKKIRLETLIVLLALSGYANLWDRQITEKVVWPELHKVILKYKPFLRFDANKIKAGIAEAYRKRPLDKDK